MVEVEELRVRGLKEDGVQRGGLEVNAGTGVGNAVPNLLGSCIDRDEDEGEAEEIVFRRFGGGVGDAVPNLLGSGIEESEEPGVGNAVGPDPLEYGIGVDNAVIPKLLGDGTWPGSPGDGTWPGSPWPERGPRLMELPIGVERERDDGLELNAIPSIFSDTSHELKAQDGDVF